MKHASGDAVLRCDSLVRHLGRDENRQQVLKKVSFETHPGRSYAIVGPSGCGKSTLLYLLGLLDRPEEGTIWIDGVAASRMDDSGATAFRNRNIGFVFQFHFLLHQFTACENVMLPLMKRGMDSPEAMRERALELLAAVGLEKKADRRSGHLSGGEQQRVAIARALVARPKVLLADEPTGNLDTANSKRVFDLLLDIVGREKLSLVVVTHNSAIAEACDRTLHMEDGRIIRVEDSDPAKK